MIDNRLIVLMARELVETCPFDKYGIFEFEDKQAGRGSLYWNGEHFDVEFAGIEATVRGDNSVKITATTGKEWGDNISEWTETIKTIVKHQIQKNKEEAVKEFDEAIKFEPSPNDHGFESYKDYAESNNIKDGEEHPEYDDYKF